MARPRSRFIGQCHWAWIDVAGIYFRRGAVKGNDLSYGILRARSVDFAANDVCRRADAGMSANTASA
jgi:hypothetical protein